MKAQIRETAKNIIIVLLLLSAILLMLTVIMYSSASDAKVFSNIRSFFSGSAVPPMQEQTRSLTDASQPLLISVNSTAGRASFYGNFEALDAAFETLGGYLAEALDTAQEPQPITAEAFTRAATGTGIYFAYPGKLPLATLAAWLDATTSLSLDGREFILRAEQSQSILYLTDGELFYALATEIDPSTLEAALEGYPSDGTYFAAESSDTALSRIAPRSLLHADMTTLPSASAHNPCDDIFCAATATALGFNPYGDASYRDDEGNTMYSESDCTLRISSDGVLTLRNLSMTARFAAESGSTEDQVEYVRALSAALIGERLGDGRLLFDGIHYADGLSTITFHYYLAGRVVAQREGAAITAVFSGNVLAELNFRVRTYTCSDTDTIEVLPPELAAALLDNGAELMLSYADANDTQLLAGWLQ